LYTIGTMEQEVKGINLTQNARREIDMGIHKETLINFLSALPASHTGYINIKLIPNFKPTKQGYTHRAIVKERKKQQDAQN
jgi:hypothetical protein